MSQVQDRSISPEAVRMRAATFWESGQPFTIEHVPKPGLRATEVLVQVKACGLVPNFAAMLNPPPFFHAPQRPAIYGLDVAGVVAAKGELVYGIDVGDRVYVNPLRTCGSCRRCRLGKSVSCDHLTLSAYFGVGSKSPEMLAAYPVGGYAEFMPAPHDALVKLPDNLDFETACRWGYLGTAYSALRRAGLDMSSSLLVNGAGGTLGLGAVVFALALGAPKILARGKSPGRLQRLKALAPDRIEIHSADNPQPLDEWARTHTDGEGADIVLDALPTFSPPGALLDALRALAPGGTHVNCGGVVAEVPVNFADVMNKSQTLIGSCWFTTTEGQQMADLAASGQVNLSMLEHKVFALEDLNEALAFATSLERDGGFTNIVICPDARPSSATL